MVVEFTKFTLRGIVGALVDSAILLLLSEYVFSSYVGQYIIAPAISFELSLTVTYTICYFWIWNHRVGNNLKDFISRFPLYNLGTLVSFTLKMVLLIAFERMFHFHPVICNLMALTISGFTSFAFGNRLVFKLSEVQRDEEPEPE
jgi:putative flippase GtrA